MSFIHHHTFFQICTVCWNPTVCLIFTTKLYQQKQRDNLDYLRAQLYLHFVTKRPPPLLSFQVKTWNCENRATTTKGHNTSLTNLSNARRFFKSYKCHEAGLLLFVFKYNMPFIFLLLHVRNTPQDNKLQHCLHKWLTDVSSTRMYYFSSSVILHAFQEKSCSLSPAAEENLKLLPNGVMTLKGHMT